MVWVGATPYDLMHWVVHVSGGEKERMARLGSAASNLRREDHGAFTLARLN